MKSGWLVAVVGMLAGCESEPFAPTDYVQPVAVVVTSTRLPDNEETFPNFQVSSSGAVVSINATTRSACGTIVKAGVAMRTHEIDVVSRIWSDPLGDCAAVPSPYVTDYSLEIPVMQDGRYRVKIFEGRGGEDPVLVGSKNVNVVGGLASR
jgi:hypothetical protein